MPKKSFTIRWLLVLTTLIAVVVATCSYFYSPPTVAPPNTVEPPQTVIDQNDPQEIVDMLLPPISKGDHYLEPAASSVESIWLFGALNNGRREENVLIENDGQNVRYRSFWLNSDGKLWCLDVALSNAQWNELINKLRSERVEKLPNLVPDISHATIYWLKYDAANVQHEACVYGISLMDLFPLFESEQKYVNNWKTIIDCLLQIREEYQEEIYSAEFLDDGTVDWNSKQKTDAGLDEILKW